MQVPSRLLSAGVLRTGSTKHSYVKYQCCAFAISSYKGYDGSAARVGCIIVDRDIDMRVCGRAGRLLYLAHG
jgi:hypothetical protein